MSLGLIAINNIPEIKNGDRVEKIIADNIKKSDISLNDGDIICVASKILSIAENSVSSLVDVIPSELAKEIGKKVPHKDIRIIELILDLVNRDLTLLDIRENYIGCKLPNGLKLTSGGIDKKSPNEVFLLPRNPDASARKISEYLYRKFSKRVAVIITDSDGREDKRGANQVAIGVFGISPLRKTRSIDPNTGNIKVQEETICDMIASSAGLLMGQRGTGVPVVLIKGLQYSWSEEANIEEALNGYKN